jgi:hypothetical protein
MKNTASPKNAEEIDYTIRAQPSKREEEREQERGESEEDSAAL